MQKELRVKLILLSIICLNLFLNIYGNSWGLPSRWHSDEKVTNVLYMLHEKSFVDTRGHFFQPTGYHFMLGIWLIPYLVFLKLTKFPLETLKEAASLSWPYMAKMFPDFATNIYIYSRVLSAILGAASVYLIFLLARRIYDTKAGIFSALFLSVSMGFVAVNHYTKYPSLLNFLIILTLLFCIIALDKKVVNKAKKYFYLAVFLSGLAVSVKFNAALLLMPIFLTYVFVFGNSLSVMVSSGILFMLGFLILTPSFLMGFKDYFFSTKLLLSGFSLSSKGLRALSTVIVGYINYLFELITIVGVPLFILTWVGLVFRAVSLKKLTKKEIIILYFVIAYWLIVIPTSQDIYPQSKYIIAIVPLLVIFAGKAMSDVFQLKLRGSLKWFLFLVIFLFSLAYTLYADLIFLKGDTRYASTEWIKKNIPSGSKIEIFSQLHLVCSDSILDDYEIIFLGQSSKKLKGDNFPRWINIEDRERYIERLNKCDSSSDYIIVNINYMNKLFAGEYLGYLPGLADYVIDLFKGKKSFVLVKTFAPKNRKIVFKKLGGLTISENILWKPIPDYEAVSPTIYVFKRIKD